MSGIGRSVRKYAGFTSEEEAERGQNMNGSIGRKVLLPPQELELIDRMKRGIQQHTLTSWEFILELGELLNYLNRVKDVFSREGLIARIEELQALTHAFTNKSKTYEKPKKTDKEKDGSIIGQLIRD